MTASYEMFSLVVAILAFVGATFYNSRAMKNQEIERRNHELQRAKSDAARDARTDIKLDTVLNSIKDISHEISDMKSEINALGKNYISIEKDQKATNRRVDKIEHRLELLHGEYRDHMATLHHQELERSEWNEN